MAYLSQCCSVDGTVDVSDTSVTSYLYLDVLTSDSVTVGLISGNVSFGVYKYS